MHSLDCSLQVGCYPAPSRGGGPVPCQRAVHRTTGQLALPKHTNEPGSSQAKERKFGAQKAQNKTTRELSRIVGCVVSSRSRAIAVRESVQSADVAAT